MQITVENAGPCRKKVRLVVPPDRVRQEIRDFVQHASRNVRMPGFRPGHVPRAVVEKKFGEAIRRDVKESLVNDGYQQAIRDHQLQPLSSPRLDIDALAMTEEAGLEASFEVDVRPEFDPKGYRGVPVTITKPEVLEREVDEQIEGLRRGRRRPTKDEGGAVEREGFAIAAIEFVAGGETVLRRDAVRMMPTTPVVGSDPAAFEAALTGKRAGEAFEIPVQLPADFEAKEAAGKDGVARITIREIYRLVPPSDEDLLRELDLPDLAALRGDLRRRIELAKVEGERRRAEDEILDRAAAENPFEIPERIVEDQLESRLARLRAHLDAHGASPEQAAAETEREKSRSRDDLLKGIRRFFLMDAIARKEKLFVTEDELEAELRKIAERNQASPAEVRRYYEEQELLGALKMDVLESKVRSFLYENAKKNEI